jgi:hypothetical protein
MRVILPEGALAVRGDRCRATGVLEVKDDGARNLAAQAAAVIGQAPEPPEPLAMANMYVGGYIRGGAKKGGLSNQCLLVKTWGRVISVDPERNRFEINDGSFPDGRGLEVYAGDLKSPLGSLPKVGQYVGVTGISVTRSTPDGKLLPAVRVRDQRDIEVMQEAAAQRYTSRRWPTWRIVTVRPESSIS